jgi:hypothetical protein
MKVVFALAAVCMSLQTFAASADTPDAALEEQPYYITAGEPAGYRTGNADVAIIAPTENSFWVDWDADDYISPPSASPEQVEESTGTIPEAWVFEAD